MKNNFYVYYLRRPDKKDSFEPERGCPFYVGKGSNGRFNSHRQEAEKLLYKPGRKSIKINIIHSLWIDRMDFEEDIIFNNLTEQEAFELEIEAIAAYGRINNETGCLANLTNGGDGFSGGIISEETRQNISNAQKGRKHTIESRKKMSLALRGRRFSEEHKNKIREANTNRVFTEEHRQNLSKAFKGLIPWNKGLVGAQVAWNKGIPHTEESRRKMSESHKGKVLSAETRDKLSKVKRGKKKSEEHRQKLAEHCRQLAEARIGVPFSLEHRAKLSESHKGNQNARRHKHMDVVAK